MPNPAWDDLDDFLSEDDFALPAVISLQGGGQVSLSVIFDGRDVKAEAGDAYTADSERPTVTCREDKVAAVRRGDTIAITFPAGVRTFDILAAPGGDEDGMATLDLAKQ